MADTKTFNNIYDGLRAPRDTTKYTMIRGTADMSNLAQWNLYETGYSVLVVTRVPSMLTKLAGMNNDYKTLINNYVHILEYEFRGLDGLEDMTGQTGTITDGINELNLINKVEWQSASTFEMRYFEKAGSVLTRVHELFLRGIKDPRTQVKHYNGLIGVEGGIAPEDVGYECETFSFLYYVTDNTMSQIEKAYFIVAAQPTKAELSIYESERGTIDFKEVGVSMNGFPIIGPLINEKAAKHLAWIKDASNANRMILDSGNFNYTEIGELKSEKGDYGATIS